MKRKVLLIEDSEADGALLRYAVEAAGLGLNLRQAMSGEAGLEVLYEEIADGPPLVLLDLNLPGMSGLEVLRRIRLDHRTTNVPVVVLSSSSHRSDVESCYRERANAYLVKPFGMAAYLPVVRTLFQFWLCDAMLP